MKYQLFVILLTLALMLNCEKNKQQAYYFLAKEYQQSMLDEKRPNKQLEEKFLFYIHKVMHNNKNNFHFNVAYADYWYYKGIWPNAKTYYERALLIKNDVPEIYYRLAQIYLKKEQSIFSPKKAFNRAKKALYYARQSFLSVTADELVNILVVLSQTYFLQQQYQEAFETIMEAFNQTDNRFLRSKIEKILPSYVSALEKKK